MNRFEIREGMQVRSIDGENLGKVVRCDADTFVIEKGFFFPKDVIARYDQIASLDDDEIRLSTTAASLGEGIGMAGQERGAGLGGGELRDREIGARDLGARGMSLGKTEQTTVPIVEEELVAEKRERQAGEVRVRKDVVTERREVSVPVTREEVHVERVPVDRGEVRADEAHFDEGTVSIPVREEEVEIRKRPVVREEVRIGKTSRQVERRAEAEVRREEVKVEKDGDVEYRGGTDIGEPRD